jgi:hypothetical protein
MRPLKPWPWRTVVGAVCMLFLACAWAPVHAADSEEAWDAEDLGGMWEDSSTPIDQPAAKAVEAKPILPPKPHRRVALDLQLYLRHYFLFNDTTIPITISLKVEDRYERPDPFHSTIIRTNDSAMTVDAQINTPLLKWSGGECHLEVRVPKNVKTRTRIEESTSGTGIYTLLTINGLTEVWAQKCTVDRDPTNPFITSAPEELVAKLVQKIVQKLQRKSWKFEEGIESSSPISFEVDRFEIEGLGWIDASVEGELIAHPIELTNS